MDTYDVRTRLFPIVLVVVPIGLFPAWFLGIQQSLRFFSVSSFRSVSQLWLHNWADIWAMSKESEVFRFWSGRLTTRMLRHSDHHLNDITKA